MAALHKVPRELSRYSRRFTQRNALSRGFRSSSRSLAAQNFTMPAMSPTMTEGNIASWKIKEGDSFSTGDVLLEIETDEAQMDVEAQDDGKVAKITQQDGAKAVKVGSRIAILAETDDDLSTLSLPDEAPSTQASAPQETSTSESQPKASSSEREDENPSESSENSFPTSSQTRKQTYPLYPSIAQLLHEKGLLLSEADKIPASGPKGRLLKGDVLAYLGDINKSYSADQSARISRLGHLDLSNIKAAPPPEKTTSTKPTEEAAPPPAEEDIADTEIAIPISLSSVILAQKRIQDTLGVTLPLSTFLARATELANEDLPRSSAEPTADELFNDVLGLNNVSSKVSRGDYIPQITALPSRPILSEKIVPRRKEADVYDILTGTKSSPARRLGVPSEGIMAGSRPEDSTNVFSVSALQGEEKRARVFLERVKTILQVEPGRLIL